MTINCRKRRHETYVNRSNKGTPMNFIPVICFSIVDKFGDGRKNLREDIDLEINALRFLIPKVNIVISYISCNEYILL